MDHGPIEIHNFWYSSMGDAFEFLEIKRLQIIVTRTAIDPG